MLTACPHCSFLLAQAPGQARPATCPRCGQALADPAGRDSATGNEAPAATTPRAPTLATLLVPETAAPVTAPARPAPAEAATPGTPISVSAAPAPADPAPAPPPGALAGAAGARAASRTARAHWPWAVVAGLSLLLVLQVLLADRARLAADPQWRPVVERACGLLGCSVPPWREPRAFAMLERSVRPARADGALQVQATFRNDARWAQPWPQLQLSLADADGRTTGVGVFAPEQYLGQAPEGLLAPAQSAHVTFLVPEPAEHTVAFSFAFH